MSVSIDRYVPLPPLTNVYGGGGVPWELGRPRARGFPRRRTVGAKAGESRFEVSKELDMILSNSPANASKVAKEWADEGVLKRFGRARLLPKRKYSDYELRMFKLNPDDLFYPEDKIITDVRNRILLAFSLIYTYALFSEFDRWFNFGIFIIFLAFTDQIAFGGGGWALTLDTAANSLSPQYRERVSIHEAGHVLTAYLLGVLPQRYSLSGLEAFQTDGVLNVQAGSIFDDPDATQTPTLTPNSYDNPTQPPDTIQRFSGIALGGLAAEYVIFGHTEGGDSDLVQLNGALRALKASRKQTKEMKEWAAVAMVTLLREEKDLLIKLAEAMRRRCSIGEAVSIIESYHSTPLKQ
ncbi:hypothetical protein AAMO2058_001724400 [Amorphochlora amoebiformis]